ncbi:MAG: transglycosylase SLT domain-containing protein [Actinomycetota bacterium]
MIGEIDGPDPAPFQRMEALSRRFGRSRVDARGPSFEALVAEAAGGLVRQLPTNPTPEQLIRYDRRPTGALGMSLFGTSNAVEALSPAPVEQPLETPIEAPTEAPTAAATPAGTVSDAANATASDADPVAGDQITAGGDPVAAQTSAAPTDAATVSASRSIDPAVLDANFSDAGEAMVQAALALVSTGDQVTGDGGPADLVRQAFRAVGVEMPTDPVEQAAMGVPIPSLDTALPGDLLVFGSPVDHVALYAGGGSLIHVPNPGADVQVEYIERPIGEIRRIVAPGLGRSSAGAEIADGLAGWSTPAVQGATADARPFTPSEAEQLYQPLFDTAGSAWQVPSALLAAVAETESGFDPTAVSSAGAQGLMQFMPATASEMGVDPWDPASAVDGAARYLRTSLDRFQEPELAIASYNAGRGAVARHGGIPPYPETQNYVRKVLDAWRSRS